MQQGAVLPGEMSGNYSECSLPVRIIVTVTIIIRERKYFTLIVFEDVA